MTYFDSLEVESIPREIKTFKDKNVPIVFLECKHMIR